MAPRSGKKIGRGNIPLPDGLPLPRPCLKNLNVPGPYYIPVPSEYFPWVLPSPCLTKPMCHCANDNFCTTSNCENYEECVKLHPLYCPYGTEKVEGCDFFQSTIQEELQENNIERRPSKSELSICSGCGTLLNDKRRISGIGETSKENNPQPIHMRSARNGELYSSSCSTGQQPEEQDKNKSTKEHSLAQSKTCPNSANILSQKPKKSGYSCCQTSSQLDKIVSGIQENSFKPPNTPKNKGTSEKTKKSTGSTTDYAADSENSLDTEFMRKPRESKPFYRESPKIHTKQLAEQLSQVRKENTSCCKSTPGTQVTSCKMNIDATKKEPHKGPSRISSTNKLSDCNCSSPSPKSSASCDMPECYSSSTPITGTSKKIKRPCQCIFPPAYKHLSCAGKLNRTCCCSKDALNT